MVWSTQTVNAKPKGAAMPPQDDADLHAGGGDAGNGDQTPNKDKQGDDEVVPKKQFLAAIKSANEKYAALEARLDAAIAGGGKKADPDPPKRYTRAELSAAVTAGQVTQEAADQLWERQIEDAAVAKAEQRATEIVTRATRTESVDKDISRYLALEPEVGVDGSDIRAKVAKEFNYFVSLGDPKDKSTELKALRAALGPIDQLELAKSGRSQHEPHRETGGGGGEGGKPSGGDKSTPLFNKLTPRQREYYDGQIKSGQYKDRKDVEATLKFANPETRPSLRASA